MWTLGCMLVMCLHIKSNIYIFFNSICCFHLGVVLLGIESDQLARSRIDLCLRLGFNLITKVFLVRFEPISLQMMLVLLDCMIAVGYSYMWLNVLWFSNAKSVSWVIWCKWSVIHRWKCMWLISNIRPTI